MTQPVPDTAEPPSPTSRAGISWGLALVLAAWFGLVGGAFDLAMVVLRRDVFHTSPYYELGRHFLWTVPVANLALMMVLGILVAGANRLRSGVISPRTAVFLFATLAIWGPLLRAPLYGVASLLVAVGVARPLSRWVSNHAAGFRRFASFSLAVFMAMVVGIAVVTLVREALAESRARARLPAPSSDGPNVLLIVMDTVRADSLGLHGYDRDTTPNLSRWAKKGVQFEWALAPAPWTFPSHCSFLTGQWPSALDAHWKPVLDRATPTLAEFLAARGYLTAGFAANTHWCSYESGLDRGFVHYEDYPLTPATILGTTAPGRWLLENLRDPRDYYAVKWIRSQSRDAAAIHGAFLDWLGREGKSGRPFFAFLNYLDAHEPFLPPRDAAPRFGLRPESAADRRMLVDYWDRDKLALSPREVELARDAYDTCIAALDRRLGALLEELDRRGVLGRTLVIVTSDHGEQFGEHGVFNHGFSLYAHEVHVPLLILGPSAPAGRTVVEPVSLRDLPATVADVLGFAADSPFPGRSLADSWGAKPRAGGARPLTALSEVDIPMVIIPQRGRGPSQRGFTASLVDSGVHYLLDIRGTEELYDLHADPGELRNIKTEPGRESVLGRFREALGEILRDHRTTGGVAAIYLNQLRSLLGSMAPRPRI
jgi:arylsulfatase A-like enzyme